MGNRVDTKQFQNQSFRGSVCLVLAEQKFAPTFSWWHFLCPHCWVLVMGLSLHWDLAAREPGNAPCPRLWKRHLGFHHHPKKCVFLLGWARLV